MLAKVNRLKVSDHNLKSAVIGSTMLFALRKIMNSDTPLQFAVVVSSKVSKKAVIRNQIKRRIYTVLREMFFANNSTELRGKYIFIVKKDILGKSIHEIKEDIIDVLK
jgi:ribonuclease P protein component